MRNILFVVPTSAFIHKEVAICRDGFLKLLRQRDIRVTPVFYDAAPLWLARDHVASVMVESPEYTDVFFLDDDVAVPPDKMLRLIESDRPITSIVYRKKMDPDSMMQEFTLTSRRWPDADADGFVTVDRASVGCACIRRDVIEEMPKSPYVGADGKSKPGVFREIIDGVFMSEDYAFCERARQRGFGTHVLLNAETVHYQGPVGWRGNLSLVWDQFQSLGDSETPTTRQVFAVGGIVTP